MSKKQISSGSIFEEKIGYSRAIVQDKWVFVSGTTGYNYANMTISEDVKEQTEQCLLNIKSVLEQAEASFLDVVRVTYIYPEAGDFEKCWPVLSNTDDPRFRRGMDRLLKLSQKSDRLRAKGGVMGALGRGVVAVQSALTFAGLYLLPTQSNTLPEQTRVAPAW